MGGGAAGKERIRQHASERQRDDRFFEIALSECPDHQLAEALLHEYPDSDFEKLKELHESKVEYVNRLQPKTIYGIWIALFAFFLSIMPESFVQRFWNYEEYEFFIAAYLLSAGALFLAFWAKFLFRSRKERQYYREAQYILRYTSLVQRSKLAA